MESQCSGDGDRVGVGRSKKHSRRGSRTQNTLNHDGAALAFHEPIDAGQAEAGALAGLPGRVERFEDFRECFGVRLRLLSDNLPDTMLYQVRREHDGTMKFVHVSAGVERLHGVTVEDALLDASLLYRQVVEEDRAKVAAAE